MTLNTESKVGVVVAAYNSNITRRLLEGSEKTLDEAGFGQARRVVLHVPGAWELPLAVKLLSERSEIVAVVALGAVIRGETTHDQHINHAVSTALMDLMISSKKPIGFGLLTCNTLEQAIHRAGGNVGNKGRETAEAVLAALDALADLEGI